MTCRICSDPACDGIPEGFYWTGRRWGRVTPEAREPSLISIVQADSMTAAAEAFGVAPDRAHGLTSPDLVFRLKDVPAGTVLDLEVARPPSAYDITRGRSRHWMDDHGYDVS